MKNTYKQIRPPKDYPGVIYRNGFCYEHHVVWWSIKGELLTAEEQIHHKDGNKRNNDIHNLEKLSSIEHGKKHGEEYTLKSSIVRICSECGKSFTILKSRYLSRKKNYGVAWEPRCSRTCQIKQQERNKNKCPQEVRDRILNLKREGKSSYFISSELKISRNTVMKYWK